MGHRLSELPRGHRKPGGGDHATYVRPAFLPKQKIEVNLACQPCHFSPVLMVEDIFQGHFGKHDPATTISRLLLLLVVLSGMLPLQRSALHYDAPPVDGGRRSDLGRRRRRDGGHSDGLSGHRGRTLGHALLAARVEASAAVAVTDAILVTAAGGRILVIQTFGLCQHLENLVRSFETLKN